MMTALSQYLPIHWAGLLVLGLIIVLIFFAQAVLAAANDASRTLLTRLVGEGDVRALRITFLLDRRSRSIEALRLVRNGLVLGAGFMMAASLVDPAEPGLGWIMIVVLALLAALLGRLGQAIGSAAPDDVALRLSPLMSLCVMIAAPLAALFELVAWRILGLYGLKPDIEEPLQTAHDELRDAVDNFHREGSVVKADRDRLGGLLNLGELEVSDIMVHRTAMRAISADDPPEECVRAVLDSPFTRMPLWRGSNDNIIGVIHARDLLTALAEPDADAASLDIVKLSQKPWFVPDTTNLEDQLNAFLRRKSHFAIVVDEYGEVQGLVTLEDILEEIVGDIADERDITIQGVRQEADGSIVVDGGVPIRDLNRALDWDLPDGDATTIAGLVIHESRSIPEERQAFTFHGKRFTVMKRVKNRITRLRIKPLDLGGGNNG